MKPLLISLLVTILAGAIFIWSPSLDFESTKGPAPKVQESGNDSPKNNSRIAKANSPEDFTVGSEPAGDSIVPASDADAEVGKQEPLAAIGTDHFLEQLREITVRDRQEALNLALRISDPDRRKEALAAICFAISANDPVQALQMAENFRLGQWQSEITENLIQQWAANDLASARNWAQHRPAGEERDRLIARVSYVWSRTNPVAAANLIVDSQMHSKTGDEALISVVHQWASVDPESANAWVEKFPPGELRDRAIGEVKGLALQRDSRSKIGDSK